MISMGEVVTVYLTDEETTALRRFCEARAKAPVKTETWGENTKYSSVSHLIVVFVPFCG